ncbi:MAG: putative PurR-regulated permease PerM [Chloroflexi bacterium AL-W]|nr:putative PurR-regulated permease PerM [Chloroflexi bacterium AL-N1]NOK71458.1 putative PurR-regulated permease PerM [Chloroflexi bacterium AL-N10]NOK77239.1 putative PurR-regulated permease PerM [Chloroflexi bacterium AL-N5]NOK86279.1 putative PurR-regulated permease PerM [Chloroflexi bacterium AL-W]NOK93249.1 putative PurR-regulated permease PerM [Chloroflexi bacterium AL-N15]
MSSSDSASTLKSSADSSASSKEEYVSAEGTQPIVTSHEAAEDLPATKTTEEPFASVQPAQWTWPSGQKLARWGLVIVALYGVGWLLWTARPVLLPFTIGLVLAYLLTPIVNILNRFGPRWLAILLVYICGGILIVTAFAFVVPVISEQIRTLVAAIPSVAEIQEGIIALLEQYETNVPEEIQLPLQESLFGTIETFQSNFDTYIREVGEFLWERVLQIINTVTFIIGFLIVPIWLFYVLNDQAKGRQFIDRLLHPRARADFWNVWNISDRVFSDYIRGQLILGLTVGLMVGIGLLVLDRFFFPGEIDFILLLAIVAGVTELVPIIGPIIGAIPGILVGFLISPVAGIAITILYIIVQQIENNFLVPRIIGESVGVHPAILTVVLISLGYIFGLVGIILAAPISAIARDLFVYVYNRLDDKPPQVAVERVLSLKQLKEVSTPSD